MKKMMFLLGLLCWMNWAFGQQTDEQTNVFVTGIVCDRDSVLPLPDAICRLNGKVYGLDEQARFTFEVNVGDTLSFSHVGYMPLKMIVNDSLAGRDYLWGIFMTRDTIQLSEVVILPRYLLDKYKPSKEYMNAIQNERGALVGAFSPVTRMDREMNQKMQIEKFARSIEMKGHVDVQLGVGLQSLNTFRKLRTYRKLSERRHSIQNHEIDLLKKIFYLEKKEKLDN